MSISQQILLPTEAESFIQNLEEFEITEIGSSKWFIHHEHLEKLNMQAILSASSQEDEFIRDFLVTYDKLKLLIKDLLVIEIWKEKIFFVIIDDQIELKVMFPTYMVLYHEATIVNLLETTLYHHDIAEACGDFIIDLVDYVYRKLSKLITISNIEKNSLSSDKQENVETFKELIQQHKILEFAISIKTLSIIRYIIDHIQSLPLSTISRILDSHDFPILLVNLLERSPWKRKNKEKNIEEHFLDNKWVALNQNESHELSKIEGQIWLSLYQLLLHPDYQNKYEINLHRKNTILKLGSYLNDILIDQLPILSELQRYIQELSLMEPPTIKKGLLLEQIPQLREPILEKYKGQWSKIARIQSKTFFNPENVNVISQAQQLASAYNLDALESLITEPPKCVVCGHPATKRCSRCKNEWYCRRECQVGHWEKHKKVCDMSVNSKN